MTAELKPCPFCGKSDLRVNYFDIDGWSARIMCDRCDGEVSGPDSEYKYDDKEDAASDAAARWNGRPPAPQDNVVGVEAAWQRYTHGGKPSIWGREVFEAGFRAARAPAPSELVMGIDAAHAILSKYPKSTVQAAIAAYLSATATQVASIVPPHCSGYSFVFEPGVLHVKKDGSGYIAVNEDDFVLEDDRDDEGGSVHWIVRLDAGEITALRDFLNGNTTADRLADKIEDLIAEFGDDPRAALECVSEHLSLRRHAGRAALASPMGGGE